MGRRGNGQMGRRRKNGKGGDGKKWKGNRRERTVREVMERDGEGGEENGQREMKGERTEGNDKRMNGEERDGN